MDMQGTRLLGSTQEQAWEALNNPIILKACIPGCEKFELTEPNTYSVVVALKIGPVSAKFSGKVSLQDILPPNSYSLNFDATGGIAGFGKGESHVQLKEVGAGVELSYTVNSKVGGKIAQLGQRLIDGVAKSLAEDFFTKFEEQLKKQVVQQNALPSTDEDISTKNEKSIPSWVFAIALLGIVVATWFSTR